MPLQQRPSSPEELDDFASYAEPFAGSRIDEDGDTLMTFSAVVPASPGGRVVDLFGSLRSGFRRRPVVGSAIWGALALAGFVVHPLIGMSMMGAYSIVVLRWQDR